MINYKRITLKSYCFNFTDLSFLQQVQAYGGKLKYTISYVPGPRGAPIEDVDVQIIVSNISNGTRVKDSSVFKIG